MQVMDWISVLVAILAGGWLAFDGSRAFLKGDYVTPSSGPYAGQLGSWAKVVSAARIDPRSTLMKAAHVVLGAALLLAAGAYAAGIPGAWWALLISAAATLWYLPFGTVASVALIVLLLFASGR